MKNDDFCMQITRADTDTEKLYYEFYEIKSKWSFRFETADPHRAMQTYQHLTQEYIIGVSVYTDAIIRKRYYLLIVLFKFRHFSFIFSIIVIFS